MNKNLLNRFTITGCVKEYNFEIFDTHIKAKFVININNYSHQVFYFVSKKFNNEEYIKAHELSDKLSNQSVIVSGNVSQRQTDGSMIFYASYIDIKTNRKERIKVEIEGFIYNNFFINIINDTPRGFNFKFNYPNSNIIYKITNINQPMLVIDNNIIQDITNWDFSISPTKKLLSAQDVESYIAEWNIIKEYYG